MIADMGIYRFKNILPSNGNRKGKIHIVVRAYTKKTLVVILHDGK